MLRDKKFDDGIKMSETREELKSIKMKKIFSGSIITAGILGVMY